MLLRSGLFPEFAALSHETAAEPALGQSLRRGLQPLAAARRRDATLLPADYGRRFVLVCQPWRSAQEPDWTLLRSDLAARLGRGMGATRLASLTWRAGRSGNPPELLALAEGREPLVLAPPGPQAEDRDEALAGFLGGLVHWMVEVTLEALDAQA